MLLVRESVISPWKSNFLEAIRVIVGLSIGDQKNAYGVSFHNSHCEKQSVDMGIS